MLRSFDRQVTLRSTTAERRRRIHSRPAACHLWPFRILHQIGAGSLGPVFRAHDPANDRFVALKLFRLDLTPEQTAQLAAALEDPRQRSAAPSRHCRGLAVRRRGPSCRTSRRNMSPGKRLTPRCGSTVRRRSNSSLLTLAGSPRRSTAPQARAFITAPSTRAIAHQRRRRGAAHRPRRRRGVAARGPARAGAPAVLRARAGGRAGLGRSGRHLRARRDCVRAGHRAARAGPGVPSLSVEGMTGLDHVTLAEVLARALAADPAARFASASDLVDVLRPVLARARRGLAREAPAQRAGRRGAVAARPRNRPPRRPRHDAASRGAGGPAAVARRHQGDD